MCWTSYLCRYQCCILLDFLLARPLVFKPRPGTCTVSIYLRFIFLDNLLVIGIGTREVTLVAAYITVYYLTIVRGQQELQRLPNQRLVCPHKWWDLSGFISISEELGRLPIQVEKINGYKLLCCESVLCLNCELFIFCTFHLFLSVLLSCAGSPVTSKFCRSHWESMAGKGRKVHHASEEEAEAKGELSGNVLEMFLESQAKNDADRREERLAADRRAETLRREEKIADEAREEARRIAAEERAEERIRKDKIAEEERAELRAEAKRLRKMEEARAAENLERAREEAARVASEKLREQQEAASACAYEQQVALIKMQAEIGERAAEAHRMEVMVTRKRDRAMAGIPNYKDTEDVEDFLLTSERKLRAGEVPEGEWLSIIASKMSGKVGSTWQDLCMTMEGYQEVKAGLLRVCGYTPKLAGEVFYGLKAESLRGLSADQLYHRGYNC